jgi:hypothetical protein
MPRAQPAATAERAVDRPLSTTTTSRLAAGTL